MQVEMRDVHAIQPYEGNPRAGDDAVAAVAASIQEFGFRQPIVVDEGGVIVVGHTRWKAAKRLGLAKMAEEGPVVHLGPQAESSLLVGHAGREPMAPDWRGGVYGRERGGRPTSLSRVMTRRPQCRHRRQRRMP